MRVLVNKNAPYQHEGAEAAAQRLARIAMILSLALIGVAGAYFGSLYLITH
jgi:hypothetical protein